MKTYPFILKYGLPVAAVLTISTVSVSAFAQGSFPNKRC